MDLREYDHITRSPDTMHEHVMLFIKKALVDKYSSNIGLIDKILDNGYIEPPQGYKWRGCYRIILNDEEKKAVLDDLNAAIEALKDHPEYKGEKYSSLLRCRASWDRSLNVKPIPYEEAIRRQEYYDLRNITLDEFVKYLFDHDVTGIEEAWYFYDSSYMWIDFDKEHNLKLFIELFGNADRLLGLYSREKLEQGFWAMMSSALEWNVHGLVWDDEVPIELRVALIESMYDLYDKFFKIDSLETSCEMWWDGLIWGDLREGNKERGDDSADTHIKDAMFYTLKKILDIDSIDCQGAALHGLGHLRHPYKREALLEYLKKHPELDDEDVRYVNGCITGDIM